MRSVVQLFHVLPHVGPWIASFIGLRTLGLLLLLLLVLLSLLLLLRCRLAGHCRCCRCCRCTRCCIRCGWWFTVAVIVWCVYVVQLHG